MPGSKMILFVCTGNICRSPMAEYLLKHRLGSGSDWQVLSAGTHAYDGMRGSRAAVEALKELKIDMNGHLSRPLTRELVDAASLIVVMTASHLAHLRAEYPGVIEKAFLLKSFRAGAGRGADVEDPIGASVAVYREIRDEIDAELPDLIAFMKSLEL